jgi:hypothetical protein
MGESYVGVAPDSTGKKVRNLQLTLLEADGTIATVQMQVVALADVEGNPISLQTDRELLRALHLESRLQTDILLRILAACEPGKEIDREMVIDELIDEQEAVDSEFQGEER